MIWWIEQIEWFLCTESDGYPLKLPKFAILGWAGIFWHRLSTNQIVRCFKLKKLKSYVRYQADFLLFEATKNIMLFWVMPQNNLGQSVCRFFYFWLVWLVWLVNANTGGPLLHCTCFYCCCYYHCYYCSLFNFGQNLCKW